MSNSTAESSESTLNTTAQQDNGITIDNSHPYFLHPSDVPRMVLVNTLFDRKGYPRWRSSIRISLSAKNKLGFIDKTCPAPDLDDPTFKLWSRCNDMNNQRFLVRSRTRFGQPDGENCIICRKN
ncbi:hypothetical protein P3L10_022873 [Capsicum annuum]